MTTATAAWSSDSGAGADAGTPMLLSRLGGELFAVDLRAAEEALEFPELEELPGMAGSAMGVFELRGQLVSVYSAERALAVKRVEQRGVVVVLRARTRRIAIALDDVEDVIMVNFSEVKRLAPRDAADGVLLGIARHGSDLVGIVDVETLITACVGASDGVHS